MRKDYNKYFEQAKRPDNEKFVRLKDEAPIELTELIRYIHREHFHGCLPDDWIYETIWNAFDSFDEGIDYDDLNLEPPCYYHEKLKWMQLPFAAGFVNEATSSIGQREDIYDSIDQGIWLAMDTIYRQVYDWINEDQKEAKHEINS